MRRCGRRRAASGIGRSRLRLGRPVSTVRGLAACVRRQRRDGACRFTGLLVQLDPLTGPLPAHPSVVADAVEVVGACAAAARRRLGVVGAVSPWQLAATVTGGRCSAPGLSTVSINTSRPLGERRLINDPRDSCADVPRAKEMVDGVQP